MCVRWGEGGGGKFEQHPDCVSHLFMAGILILVDMLTNSITCLPSCVDEPLAEGLAIYV